MRSPDLQGTHGSAWRVPVVVATPAEQATLAQWFVQAPGYHILWDWYAVSLIFLRNIPGVPPAVKNFADANYEVFVMALDPESKIDVDNATSGKGLRPVNIIQQFKADNDAHADLNIQQCVQAIVEGKLSPDSDYRKKWQAILAP